MNKKSVTVLFSGGIDSTSCVRFFSDRDYDVRALFVDYGQAATAAEAQVVEALRVLLNVPVTVIKASSELSFGTGELVGRNAFLIFAAIFLGGCNEGLLAIGVHAGTPYYDCSPTFIDRVNVLVEECTNGRVDDVKEALEGPLKNSVDTLFGGSVAKRTYVDGLSDVDSLLILDDSSLEGSAPSEALGKVAGIIQRELGGLASVTTGKLAVTVRYLDGMELQLLPAFRTKDGLKVPSWRRDGWSSISPQNFQNELTKRNEQCGGKLIPTIKLAKAVIATLPESQRLTGYHVESLAIAAFKDYSGPKTTVAMLPAFFDKARELVTAPIRDSTGQSVHVDEYLGPAGSVQREAASHILSRIGKRMRNASAHKSRDQWQAIFGLTDE